MRKFFIIALSGLFLVASSTGFSERYCSTTKTTTCNNNHRGEKRPQDGRGKHPNGRRSNQNQDECQKPNKGPGHGQGDQRGAGKYRD